MRLPRRPNAKGLTFTGSWSADVIERLTGPRATAVANEVTTISVCADLPSSEHDNSQEAAQVRSMLKSGSADLIHSAAVAGVDLPIANRRPDERERIRNAVGYRARQFKRQLADTWHSGLRADRTRR